MSVEAITWALKQPLSQSSTKFVLVAMANCADGASFECWPSIAYLCDATAQNRKTVIENIKRLLQDGYITDTGARKGNTGSIKSYRMNLKAVPKTEPLRSAKQSQKRTSTENGTVPKKGHLSDTENGTASVSAVPKTEPLEIIPTSPDLSEAVPKTDGSSTENGHEAVPKTGHGTVSEPSTEPSVNQTLGAAGVSLPLIGELLPPASADAPAPEKPSRKSKAGKGGEPDALQVACRETWKAYGVAYTDRYGTAPVRNEKVSSMVKAFVKRLGHDESPMVAAWFVDHPGGYYVGRLHDFGCLLADAEKLRTEWATGRVMTAGKARQSDRAGTTMAALAEVLAEQGESL